MNGDITVPARSGSQGPIGTTDPFGEDVPISYVCNVQHVPLPGDPSVTTPIKDFLMYGTQPRKTEHVCLNEGKEVRFKDVNLADEAAATARTFGAAAAPSGNPGLQMIRIPGNPIAVTDDDFPVDMTVQANGARMAVTPLSGENRGTPVYYGPITGDLTLKTNAGGDVTVLDDGAPVPARTTREPGDPAVPADGGGGGQTPGPTQSPADTHAPNTSIAKKPKRRVKTKAKRAKAVFSFKSDEAGVKFQCKLDRGRFKPCSAKLTLRAKPGRHKLRVRAVDSAGNADPTPATWSWRVRRKR